MLFIKWTWAEPNKNIKVNLINREFRLVLTQDLGHGSKYKLIKLKLENTSKTNYPITCDSDLGFELCGTWDYAFLTKHI